VLFNIGALHTQIAAAQNLSSDDGLKLAAGNLQVPYALASSQSAHQPFSLVCLCVCVCDYVHVRVCSECCASVQSPVYDVAVDLSQRTVQRSQPRSPPCSFSAHDGKRVHGQRDRDRDRDRDRNTNRDRESCLMSQSTAPSKDLNPALLLALSQRMTV
jgi:hypothetical protein